MKIVFFGSTDYSLEVLKELLAKSYIPCLVVTSPDTPQGRGLKLLPSPVKRFSQTTGLEVLTPHKLDKEFISLIEERKPDLFIVVSYGRILPPQLLKIPKILPLGVHPSLLPRYRGPAPINWVLINGEKETGVTLFKLSKGVDEGEIIVQEKISIDEDDDFLTLSEKVYSLSKRLLVKTLPLLEKGDFSLEVQPSQGISFAPKIDKTLSKINWQQPALKIRNLIKALVPKPCAFSFFRGKRIKFYSAEVEKSEVKESLPGEIVQVFKHTLKISTSQDLLLPLRLQPEGKKVLEVSEFINGYHPKQGEAFT
ncbi:MAG TPA: methionyl-tRNA formyltransferase [Candidatus Omnitrophica bacterium]|nr:MAG: methionyl-tRNA formyltransferase [Candidatus Omnitrophota bacterium]RKY44060.1 MAG: methionyl-tRNA formyltransferase [Candidatus Omnitrophota bacterium]HEC68891.1 methionyl-tRNA formyltransferase [Candidatus Omnitrophota bacterium]